MIDNCYLDFIRFQERLESYEMLSEEIRLKQYRREVMNAERNILAVTGDPFCNNISQAFDSEVKRYAVEQYLGIRYTALSRMFRLHCTDKEIARIDELNSKLLNLTNVMFSRTAENYRRILDFPREKGTGMKVTGKLFLSDTVENPVGNLPWDPFYGSDFQKIIPVISFIGEMHQGKRPVVQCDTCLHRKSRHNASMTDKQLDLDNRYDYGHTWAEGSLRHPKLEHVTICYATNSVVTFHGYSVPDLMHLSGFELEVEMKMGTFFDISA